MENRNISVGLICASRLRSKYVCAFILLGLTGAMTMPAWCQEAASQSPAERLKEMTLTQLADVEVTTVSKEPEGLMQTPAAIYVLTQEDIRRAGVHKHSRGSTTGPRRRSGASRL